MEAVNWERWARAAGSGFVVLALAAFVVGGEAPKVGDSTGDLVSYYDGDRGKVLASSLLFGFALVFFLWFAAAIANLLRERGEGRVAAAVIAGGTAFATLQFVLTGLAASLAYSIAGGGEPGITKALFDLQWALDVLAALPAAIFVLSSSVGFLRARVAPAWLCWAGAALAALFLLRSTNWARDGFWSPTGEYTYVLIPFAMLWILVTSVTLARAARTMPRTEEASAASASTAGT